MFQSTQWPFLHLTFRLLCPNELPANRLFEEMELGGIVNFIAFRQDVAGYNRIKEKSKQILTLIDFSKPSTEKRFLSSIWRRNNCCIHQ